MRKASIRAKVEHPFCMFVAVFGKQVFDPGKLARSIWGGICHDIGQVCQKSVFDGKRWSI
jgi:hypothetical protein